MILRHSATAIALAAVLSAFSGCSGESESSLIKAAAEALESQQPRAAIIHLKTALQRNPDSAQARLLLGQALILGGDYRSGLLELRKAHDLKAPEDIVVPELARAMLATGEGAQLLSAFQNVRLQGRASADLDTSLATAHLMAKGSVKAQDLLSRALAADAQFAPALTLQATMGAAEGRFDEALALLDGVLARDPGNGPAGNLRGDILRVGKKDNASALEAYRKVLGANPKLVSAHVSVIHMLLAEGRVEDAKQQFAAMRKEVPQNPESLLLEAQFAFGDKDLAKVKELTDRLLRVAPDNVRVLELAGAAEYARKSFPQAEMLLTQAVKAAPSRLPPRNLLARVYIRTGQPEKALALLEPLIDGQQADATSLALAGSAHLLLGDAQRAETLMQAASRAAPEYKRMQVSAAAVQLASGRQTEEAIGRLEALASSDTDRRADLLLVTARLSANDVAGALKAVDALQAKQAEEPLAYQLRGQIQLLQKDTAAARASFETALAKNSGYFPANASLATLDLAAGKPELARQRLEGVLKTNPGHLQAKIALAELSARTGATSAEVTAHLADAVKIKPDEPRAHVLLVNHLLASDQARAALNAAQAGMAALPGSVELIDALGRAQMANGESLQAVTTFRRLASMQPSRAAPNIRLAEALSAGMNHDEAVRSLRRALELQPGMPAAQQALVATLSAAGKHQDALAAARDIQTARPGEAIGFVLAGDVEYAREAWDAAAALYRVSMPKQGFTTRAAINLHGALLKAGKTADAERFVQDWQKTRPQDVTFRYYLGDRALAAKDAEAAERHYRSVLAIEPKHPLAMNNVAWLMATQSRPGAAALAAQAVALLPNSPQLLDTLATAQAAEGQVAQAITTQKSALAIAPSDMALKLNLARLHAQAGDKPSARAELEALAALGDRFAKQSEVAELLQRLR
jgi:putative PEP-CTERM system TPR-repeat lipoprotein